jgi:hypothetical protein
LKEASPIRKYFVVTILSLFLFIPHLAQADSLFLSPCDFNPESEDASYTMSFTYLYVDSGSTYVGFFAPVHLPEGTKVTSVVVFYEDNHATGNLGFYLRKINAYTNSNTNMANWTSSGTSPGLASHKISPIVGGNVINNGGYIYVAKIFFTLNTAGPNVFLRRVKINYK